MADLIIFRCPQTGMDVETLLHKQEHEEARPYYLAVTRPACTRLNLHEVQPRSVSRADPFSGRFRVDIDAGNVLAVARCLHPRDRLTRTSAISGTECETSHARDHQQIIGAVNIRIQTEASCRRNGSC